MQLCVESFVFGLLRLGDYAGVLECWALHSGCKLLVLRLGGVFVHLRRCDEDVAFVIWVFCVWSLAVAYYVRVLLFELFAL